MSDIKPSKIVCKSCGYEPNILSDVCIKCGGEIVKICGNCGNQNGVEKVRCDSCNTLLALTPQKKIDLEKEKEETKPENKKIKIEFEPITETMSREDSERGNYKKPEVKFNSNPISEDVKKTEKEKKAISEYVDQIPKKLEQKEEPKECKEKSSFKNKRFLIVIVSSLVVSLLLSYFLFIRKSLSRYNLLFTANKYLSALKNRDYEKAYSYLSNNSKTIISFTDYVKTSEDYYSRVGSWDFKDLKIYYFDNNQSVVKYKIKEGNEWKDDYLNFIKEHDIWTRPYVWNLFEQIDEAFNLKDFSKALFLSQKLYLIDPLDPRSSGYLCWSEYFMRLYDKSMESCKRTIEISSIYPIKYYTDEDIFWYRFNYADSLKFLGKNEEAIKVFGELLKIPDVPSKSKCSVFLSRADAYARIKSYENSLKDLSSAVSICGEGMEKNDAEKRIAMMNGVMCEEALKFFKNYKYENARFEEFINSVLKNIKLQNPKFKYDISFSCKHTIGPEYEVFAEIKKISKNPEVVKNYSGRVNLWDRTLELNSKEEK
ncbi:MAG: hypothetical protein N2Z60_01510 [Elusimicrobiales bacterium]|nr:hypothetical protein [Elusimicrobiales bacterium]